MFRAMFRCVAPRGSYVSLFAVLAVVTAVVCLVRSAAALGNNTIDPTVLLSSDGRHALVTAIVTPEGDEIVTVKLTVTQWESEEAYSASGRGEGSSSGATQRWPIETNVTRGSEPLHPGPARVDAVATARSHGQITEVRRWWRDVTLVN